MLKRILASTFQFLARRPIAYWSPLVPVVLVDVAYEHALYLGALPGNLLTSLGTAAIGTVLAVTTHRLVLLGRDHVPKLGFRLWTRREVHFLAYLIAIQLLMAFVPMAVSLVLYLLGIGADFPILFVIPTVLFVAYLASRLSLVLPAAAVDDRVLMPDSWRLTRPHKLSIFIVFAIVPSALGLPSVALAFYASNVAAVVATLGGSIGLVIGICTLSMAYKVIREGA